MAPSTTSLLPTITGLSQNTTQTQTGSNTGSNNSIYSAGQTAAQGNILSTLQNILSGSSSVPTSLGMSQQAIQQAMQNYNQFVTPQLAAQNGAGSPALASGAAQYLGNLQAQSSQNAITNYLQGTNTLGNFAYNALGNTLMSNNTANQTQGLNQIGANVNSGGSLASILSALTGLPGYGSP